MSLIALVVALGGTAWAIPSAGTSASVPNVKYVVTRFTISNGDVATRQARCPAGYAVTGGGYTTTSQNTHITGAAPLHLASAYTVSAYEAPVNVYTGVGRSTSTVSLVAYCAPEKKPVVFGP
jgi:hypothetical protein